MGKTVTCDLCFAPAEDATYCQIQRYFFSAFYEYAEKGGGAVSG